MAVLMLLWTIYLAVIIFYGNGKANKMTCRPFRIAGVKFVNQTIQASAFFFLPGNPDSWDEWVLLCIQVLAIIDFTCLITFVRSILTERCCLTEYIIFQKKIPLEQLDQNRSKYQDWERSLEKRRNFTLWLYILIPIVFLIALVIFKQNASYDQKEKTLSFILGLIILILLANFMNFLIYTTLKYLMVMKIFQNFEYNRHKKHIIIETVIMVFSILIMIAVSFFISFRQGCQASETKFYLNKTNPNNNFCEEVKKLYDKNQVLIILINQVFATLPFAVYYTYYSLADTHDCFECFNRIPHLRYSIYQYTLQERNNNYELKVGKGAVKLFKD